jgi:hypothetical protein
MSSSSSVSGRVMPIDVQLDLAIDRTYTSGITRLPPKPRPSASSTRTAGVGGTASSDVFLPPGVNGRTVSLGEGASLAERLARRIVGGTPHSMAATRLETK